MRKFTQYIKENMNLTPTNDSDSFDTQNYEYAKFIFEREIGRLPNMNNDNDMLIVSSIQFGIEYTRRELQKD